MKRIIILVSIIFLITGCKNNQTNTIDNDISHKDFTITIAEENNCNLKLNKYYKNG